MAVTYTVGDQGTFVCARAEGVLTVEAVVEHVHDLVNDAEVACRFRHLLDVRRVVGRHLDAAQLLGKLHAVYASAQPKVVGSRCAVVANDGWWFNLHFQRQCEMQGVTMIVFNDPATACMWLGVDYDLLVREAAQPGWAAPVQGWTGCSPAGCEPD